MSENKCDRLLNYNNLIPEAPILIYPSLAATIGLEQATMLSILTHIARANEAQNANGYSWFYLIEDQVQAAMPFWQAADIQRISTDLREQGLLLIASAPYLQSRQLKFAFNERMARTQRPAQSHAPTQNQNPAKNLIPPNWSPDSDTLAQLAQHQIPAQFAHEQVPEFVNYWRERGETAHAWGSKFMQHCIRKWRDFEARENARNRETYMHRNWRPSEDAFEVLTTHAGISRDFVEDAIPEFVLYWREQGSQSNKWNKKFRDHVSHQWARYRCALEHDPTPKRIASNWQPSEDVYEVLRLANIDLPFAQALVQEFVIYWRDSNQVHTSWNTRFLQFVKKRWAKRSAEPMNTGKSTRELSIAEQLSDRSWAL